MRALIAALVLLASATGAAEARVALIIGNSDYGGGLADLRSPAKDAELVEQLARDLAFEQVIVERDADRAGMIRALRRARDAARGGTVFFYYSGHGVQVDGESYLVPAKTEVKALADIPLEGLSVRQALGFLKDAKLKVVALDACRNNPFSGGTKSVGSGGLARDKVHDLEGTLVSYAAAPGTVAYDGEGGEPSPYTRALVKHMRDPDLDLPNVFMAVRGELAEVTARGAHGAQRSEEVSTLTRAHRVRLARLAGLARSKSLPAMTVLAPGSLAAAVKKAMPEVEVKVVPDDCAGECLRERAAATQAEEIVLASRGEVGADTVVALSRYARREGEVVARSSAVVRAAAVDLDAPLARLRSDAGAALLKELRMGVVLLEEEGGEPLSISRVKACVEDALVEAGAPMIDAEQVAVLRDEAAVERILRGRLDDALGSDDVDVIIAGRAVWTPVEGSRWSAGVVSYDVDLRLRMIQADNAELVLSRQLTARAQGLQKARVLQDGAKKLCDQVTPALADALEARASRGQRVRFELVGGGTQGRARQVALDLERSPLVKRARVRKADTQGAIIELTVEGDAVHLALELEREPGLVRLTRVESGRLVGELR